MVNHEDTQVVRVCFVAPKMYPLLDPGVEGVFGGAEVDLYRIGTALSQDVSFAVSCVVADYGQDAVERIGSICVIRGLDFSQNVLRGALRLWGALRNANADVYVIKTASPGVPLLAAFCRRNNRAFVYRTAHRDECDGTYRRKHPFWGRAFARALRRATAVLAQNHDDAALLRQTLGVDSSVIRNAHPLPELAPQTRRDIVLWAGRSAAFKHPQRFLDLASQFPEQRFVMICQQATGDDGYQALCDRAQAIGNLEFIPRVPFHEMDGYFRRARIFVNTSDSEGFPNTFLQAAARAVPILSYAVNPDGFLAAYSCGIGCGGRFDRMVEGLRFLLEQDRYVDLGANARRYAEECHDLNKVIEQYKTLFRQLAGSSGNPNV